MSKRIAPSPDAQHSDDGLSSGGYHTKKSVSCIEQQETGFNWLFSKDQSNDLISSSPVRSLGSRHCKKEQAGGS